MYVNFDCELAKGKLYSIENIFFLLLKISIFNVNTILSNGILYAFRDAYNFLFVKISQNNNINQPIFVTQSTHLRATINFAEATPLTRHC